MCRSFVEGFKQIQCNKTLKLLKHREASKLQIPTVLIHYHALQNEHKLSLFICK